MADGDDQLVPLANGNNAALASYAALSFAARGSLMVILLQGPGDHPGLFFVNLTGTVSPESDRKIPARERPQGSRR